MHSGAVSGARAPNPLCNAAAERGMAKRGTDKEARQILLRLYFGGKYGIIWGVARIGIFGGSFNPVHSGHVGIARRAVEELCLDKLIVVPAAVSPFKVGAADFIGARYDRVVLLQVAFNGMEKVEIDERELRRGGVSYSIDTVREIAAENEGAEIIFLIGEDSVEGLPRWKDYEELKKLCRFHAYPRTKESSTEVRARLAEGKAIGDLVPAAVELFIRAGVKENEDKKIAAVVKAGLKRKGGYCPCRLAKTEENFCPCAEFRGQVADEGFEGLCHCRLYYKPRKGEA